MSNPGRNVWFDLMTAEPQGAVAFYPPVLEWKIEQWQEEGGGEPYTMWVASSALGGVMRLPKEAQALGVPAQWLAYTTVADVDAAVALATGLGARVLVAPLDMSGVGRFASLVDPQGAAFAVFAPSSPSSEPAAAELGQFGWAELHSPDPDAAWGFYAKLFGWQQLRTLDLGPAGAYLLWHDSSRVTKGGVCRATSPGAGARWLHYVTVQDVPAALARVTAHGGTVLGGPMQVPGGDWVAQCRDPQGIDFAVYARGAQPTSAASAG